MNNYKSVLTFDTYYVEKVEFHKNPMYHEVIDGLEIDLDIGKSVSYDISTKVGEVSLHVSVFNDPLTNNYPFSLDVYKRQSSDLSPSKNS